MNKLPAMQFYPADWKKDAGIQSLSFEDRQVWFEILLQMFESPRRGVLLMPNGKLMKTDALSRIIGYPKAKLTKALARIAEAGVSGIDKVTGALLNRRMVRDEEVRCARAEAGNLGAEFGALGGEFGALGGRPKAVENNPPPIPPSETPQATPSKPSPSSSSSITSSSSGEGNGEEERKRKFGTFSNVVLSDLENTKLADQFGVAGAAGRINNLSEYMASKGKKYNSHYATLLVWERMHGNGKGNGNGNGKQYGFESKAEAIERKQLEGMAELLDRGIDKTQRDFGGIGHEGPNRVVPATPRRLIRSPDQ